MVASEVGLFRLSYPALLRDEAIFDHLVDVLLLSKATLVVEMHMTHLCADVGLVDTLRMTMNETMRYQALINQ